MLNSLLQEDLLDSGELKLIKEVRVNNRLLLAIILKYFQGKGRYPTNADRIEQNLIFNLAEQLGVDASLFESYSLDNRTAIRYRNKTREFLNYKIATSLDSKKLINWIIKISNDGPYTMPQYLEKSYCFLQENKIEPFTPQKMDRYIRSAISSYETQFLKNIKNHLTSQTIKKISKLLQNDIDNETVEDSDSEIGDEVTLKKLKLDVAGAKLKHVKGEIKKPAYALDSTQVKTYALDSTCFYM